MQQFLLCHVIIRGVLLFAADLTLLGRPVCVSFNDQVSAFKKRPVQLNMFFQQILVSDINPAKACLGFLPCPAFIKIAKYLYGNLHLTEPPDLQTVLTGPDISVRSDHPDRQT